MLCLTSCIPYVQGTAQASLEFAQCLRSHLTNALLAQFDRIGGLDDLNEVVSLYRETLRLLPVHTDRSCSLNNLAAVLSTRFCKAGEIADLHEAVALHREALALRPVPHPDRSISLKNLAAVLFVRIDRICPRHGDLNEAAGLYREILRLSQSTDQSQIFVNAGARSLEHPFYIIKMEDNKYILNAGNAHGITNGAEFAVYLLNDDSPPMTLIVVNTGEYSAVMDVPPGASRFALVTSVFGIRL
jgi:hypothetical protein